MHNLVNKIKIYGIKKSILYGFNETIGRFYRNFFQKSYSQSGEDLIIDKLLSYKKSGTYIDVGAFNPSRLSNTKRFYDKGWRGVNIEPDYNNFLKFLKFRPEDVNLNIGIGTKNEILSFFRFNIPTLSTFSSIEADKYKDQGYQLLNIVEVEVKPLSTIFSEVLNKNSVDFLSVDTEGFDMEVLKSNNWDLYRPKVICIETVAHTNDNNQQLAEDTIQFLENKNYKIIQTTAVNTIFVDNE